MFSAHNHDHNYFTKLTPNPLTVKKVSKHLKVLNSRKKNEDACMLWHIRIIRKLLSVFLRLSCLQEDYDTDEASSRHVYLLRLFGLSQCLQVLFLQSSLLTHLSHTWYKQSSWTRLWYLSCSSHSQHCYHPRFQLHSKWYCNRLVFLENLRLANDSIWPLGS